MQVNTGIYGKEDEDNDSKRQNLDKKSYPNKTLMKVISLINNFLRLLLSRAIDGLSSF